jgi:hypothetical protein
MTIKCNEKDIEDWLYDHPEKVKIKSFVVREWVARQYHVPSGIIDLLGYMGSVEHIAKPIELPMFCVVEVKNVSIDSSALTQVCRYSQDIHNILFEAAGKNYWDLGNYTPNIFKIVIAPRYKIEDKIWFEADALNVNILLCDVNLSLNIRGPLIWNKEYARELGNMYQKQSKDFEKYFQKDVFEEFMEKLEKNDSKE